MDIRDFIRDTAVVAAIAFIPAIAQVVNPVHTIALKVTQVVVDKFLSHLAGEYPSRTTHWNKSIVSDAIIVGLGVATIGLVPTAVALLAINIAYPLSLRVKLMFAPSPPRFN